MLYILVEDRCPVSILTCEVEIPSVFAKISRIRLFAKFLSAGSLTCIS
jgi:hypothetical protein